MITKSLTTLSGSVKIKIPENLSEITLGQMIEMQKASDTIPLVPELTKEIADNIIDFKQLQEIRERLLSLAHQIKYAYDEAKLPTTLIFGTEVKRKWFRNVVIPKRIKVPQNLSIEPAGAYLASRDVIAEEINRHIAEFGEDQWEQNFVPSLDCCASILAHYFYCPVTGMLYNEQRAESFREEVLKLSVAEALPIARFFIVAYPDLSRQKISLYKLFRLLLKKRLALRRIKNLNTLQS